MVASTFESVAAASLDLDVAGLQELGRSRREQVPRRSIGVLAEPSPDRDPVELLRRSNADRLPTIAPIRIGRMLADPFAYLRGSAVVMAEDIGPAPVTGIPVQVCGDAHIDNFGIFATTERNLVFDLNDFDETTSGAWEWDVQRLAASLVVAARVFGCGGSDETAAARAMASAYRQRTAEMCDLSALERRYLRIDVDRVLDAIRESDEDARTYEKQVAKARRRDRFHALARFTEVRDGRRVIVADPPIVQPLEPDTFRADLVQLYEDYCASVPSHVARLLDDYRFVDIALKVVGVGSVGTRALMVLAAGRADLDPLFLQIKEATTSVFARFGSAAPATHEGRRVVEGQRLMQAAGDMFLGWGRAGRRDYYIRQLRDMKGSIDVTAMSAPHFEQFAAFCGTTLAQAHARSQHPALISGYLGRSGPIDDAVATFGAACADRTERDHAALQRAVDAGRIEAVVGV